MAHMREGSVVNYGTSPTTTQTFPNAVISNITDHYLEIEWTDPNTSIPYVIVRPWSAWTGVFTVVTD